MPQPVSLTAATAKEGLALLAEILLMQVLTLLVASLTVAAIIT